LRRVVVGKKKKKKKKKWSLFPMRTSSDGDFVVSPVEAEKNGGNEKEAATTQAVQVAVNIRPLIAMERVQGCKDCITIVPGEPQVSRSSLCFCFCMEFHSFLVYGCGLFSMPFATNFFWR
jgi:hypothetical protein